MSPGDPPDFLHSPGRQLECNEATSGCYCFDIVTGTVGIVRNKINNVNSLSDQLKTRNMLRTFSAGMCHWAELTEPYRHEPLCVGMINIKCPLRSLRNLLWLIPLGCGSNGKWLIYYDNHRQSARRWHDSTVSRDFSLNWPSVSPPSPSHDTEGEIQRVDLRKTSKKMFENIFVSKTGINWIIRTESFEVFSLPRVL